MIIEFAKYQGAGNDFILIDNRKNILQSTDYKIIEKICDRHFGIGADGLMLLHAHKDYQFEMKFYNCDGLPASMCGNGARCIVAFSKKLGLTASKVSFLAPDGPHEAIIKENSVALKMTDVSNIEKRDGNYFLNTGVPHFIQFVDNIEQVDVYNTGKQIRFSKVFGEAGTNVNFVQSQNGTLKIRTYERGVENETLACGTGITAAAIAYSHLNNMTNCTIPVIAKGGQLSVSLELNGSNSAKNIWLEGPAKLVFEGKIETNILQNG